MEEPNETPEIDSKAIAGGLITGLLYVSSDELLQYLPDSLEHWVRLAILLLVVWLVRRAIWQLLLSTLNSWRVPTSRLARAVPALSLVLLIAVCVSLGIATWESFKHETHHLPLTPSIRLAQACDSEIEAVYNRLKAEADRYHLGEISREEGIRELKRANDAAGRLVDTIFPSLIRSYLGEGTKSEYLKAMAELKSGSPNMLAVDQVKYARDFVSGELLRRIAKEQKEFELMVESLKGNPEEI